MSSSKSVQDLEERLDDTEGRDGLPGDTVVVQRTPVDGPRLRSHAAGRPGGGLRLRADGLEEQPAEGESRRCRLPRPTPSHRRRSVLEGGASSAGAVSACRPRAWTGLVALERFTTGEPCRSLVATPQSVSGMWGGIQTGWLRHAHLIDSDLHSIPVPGSGEACSDWCRLARSLQRSCLEGLVDWQPVPTDASGRLALSRGWFARIKTVPRPWPADQRRLVTAGSAPFRPSASDSRPKLKDGASASDRSGEPDSDC